MCSFLKSLFGAPDAPETPAVAAPQLVVKPPVIKKDKDAVDKDTGIAALPGDTSKLKARVPGLGL